MHPVFKKRLFPLFVVLGLSLTGCENGDSVSSKAKGDSVLDFVAVTSTSWDAEVTLGDFNYTFDLKLKDDAAKTLAFKATCVGEKPAQGGGGPGGPFGAKESSASSISTSVTDYSSHNFSWGGTWQLDEGYGYVLSFTDTGSTVVHSDYDKTQGRHCFYYNVVNGDDSAVSYFQAKDSAFRSSLASDYKTWDERDSKYVFTALATGNNNSVAYSYLYLHKGGDAVLNAPNNSSRAVTMGLSWTEKNSVISLVKGDAVYASEASLNSSHPGYRIIFNSSAFYYTSSASISWQDFTSADFDGKTLYAFSGSYSDGTPWGGQVSAVMNLTDAGKAVLYTGNKPAKSGTYVFKEEVFTITMNGAEPVQVEKGSDGNYTYETTITVSGFMGSSEVKVSLVYKPAA